jgi:hypothetical protein
MDKPRDSFIKQCEVCHKDFKAYFCYIKLGGSRFCSYKCSNGRRLPFTKEHRQKISLAKVGVKKTFDTKRKMSEAQKKIDKSYMLKDKHWNWQGGKSNNRDIHSLNNREYRQWRMEVFTRDNFECKMCKEKVGLQAHHILSWREFPELRYDINNGIALCRAHHPRKRAEEKRLSPYFMELVSVSK